MSENSSALVLFSGGQDSTVCLAAALEKFAHVETVGFSYGQRHDVELQARQTVLAKLRDELNDYIAHSNGSYAYEGMGDEADSPLRAVRMVSGRIVRHDGR